MRLFKYLGIAAGIAVAYALIVHALFNDHRLGDLLGVMTIGFIFLVPFAMGYLAVWFLPAELARRYEVRIFVPWVPIVFFFGLTLSFGIEGWACWLMILPLFLIAASIGGILAGWDNSRKGKNQQLKLSLTLLLPFIVTIVEKQFHFTPARYEAYTSAEIHSRPGKIWSNVIRVREIPEKDDHGWLTRDLGLPRPIKAELDYAGVGGSRLATFSKGLVFREVVEAYEDEKMMFFTITANPHDIPSTTMDKHIVIGGDYFNVEDGTYVLEQTGQDTYRLHLYSHFTLSTDFNFYAGWWAEWIMKDIQNNILQVIQTRCEQNL